MSSRPALRSRRRLFAVRPKAWIVAAALVALGAVPQAGAQSSDASLIDSVITELVTNAFGNDSDLRTKDILIMTVARVVYLRGYADTLEQVERAGTLAHRIKGVSGVSNAIRVPHRPDRA